MIRFFWFTWFAAAVATALGAAAYHVSAQHQQVTLPLKVGEQATFRVQRVLPDELWLSAVLGGLDSDACKHQGRFEGTTGHVIMAFPDPGDSLRLEVSGPGRRTVYRALPAFNCGASGDTATRRLIPFPAPENPNQTLWPPSLSSWTSALIGLRPGSTPISVVVQEVAPSLTGKTAILTIEPPVSLKMTRASHRILGGLFIWWPAYALVLVVLAILLVRASLRR